MASLHVAGAMAQTLGLAARGAVLKWRSAVEERFEDLRETVRAMEQCPDRELLLALFDYVLELEIALDFLRSALQKIRVRWAMKGHNPR